MDLWPRYQKVLLSFSNCIFEGIFFCLLKTDVYQRLCLLQLGILPHLQIHLGKFIVVANRKWELVEIWIVYYICFALFEHSCPVILIPNE